MKNVMKIMTLLFMITTLVHAASNVRGFQRGTSWDDYVYPTVTVVDKDGGSTTGSQLVHRLIPDLETFCQKIAKGVCQKLYKEVGEVPNFDELVLELEYRDGVAYKSGRPPRITINISTKYLEEQYNQNGDEAILYEIAGVNWHELTHAYQHIPRNAGGYSSGTEYFGFIEGTADAVRILSGFHNTRRPSAGGSWTTGYTTSGFFIEWVQNTYDEDFLYKLNQSCLSIDPWSFEKACKNFLGRSVRDLWDEYQYALKGGAAKPVARIASLEKNLIGKGEAVRFTNNSYGNPTSYLWSFPGADVESSSEKSPVVTYSTPGIFGATLTVSNGFGSHSETKQTVIIVADAEGAIIELTKPDGAISTDAEQPFDGEDVQKLLDKDPSTKFCTITSPVEIEYDAEENYRLVAYSFTNANDSAHRDPLNWTVSGSKDGTSWSELDQQSDIDFPERLETQMFAVNSSEKYRYYRFDISAETDTSFQLADLVLYGTERSVNIATTKGNVNKTKFSYDLSGSTLHLSNDFTYGELEIYNLRGVKLESLKGGNITGNAVSLDHLASGCYIMRVKAKDMNNVVHSFSSSLILK